MLEVVLFLLALFLVIAMWPIIWRLAVALLALFGLGLLFLT